MAITRSSPKELLSLAYEAGVISITSTAAHGAALSTPWGGTFTVRAGHPDVYVEFDIYFTAHSGAADTTYHVLVDGTCRMERTVKLGSTAGHSERGRTKLTGLAVGSHTIAVQGATASGTGFLSSGAPPIQALLTVAEVA